MAQGQRFKFQGSRFAVQSGNGTGVAVTGITQANPAVVTSTAHGLDDGDVVRFDGVVGMTELNGRTYVIDNVTANTFELIGVNSTAYAAYVSGGTAAPATFSDFCELTGVNQQDGTADRTEVTSICSTAKEFVTGLSDSGTVTLDYNFAPLQNVQAALRAAKVGGTDLAFEIVLPEAGGRIRMFGTVTATSFQGGVNGVWTGSATVQLSGEVYVLPPAV